MSIIKNDIKLNGNDLNIKFRLDISDELFDYQQNINNTIYNTSNSLINPITDVECRRFANNIPVTIGFMFSGQTTFFDAGYSNSEISNSFFIVDYYDTFNVNNQTRLFRTYLTKINYNTTLGLPIYLIDNSTKNQLHTWYVPESYISSISGDTITGYTKFSFYSAKTGKISSFYNNDYVSSTTMEKFFFKTELNIINRTWKIITPSFPSIIAVEITGNDQYTNRLNNTIDSITKNKQAYPLNHLFDYRTREYLPID
jgi:hypothetical protein